MGVAGIRIVTGMGIMAGASGVAIETTITISLSIGGRITTHNPSMCHRLFTTSRGSRPASVCFSRSISVPGLS